MGRKFTYSRTDQHLWQAASLDVEFQAYQACKMIDLYKWSEVVFGAELILELAGPMYVFKVHFEPNGYPDNEVFVICGILPWMYVSIPYDKDLVVDAKERIMLYLGHLLLYSFSNPGYRTPFPLVKSDGLAKYTNNEETRKLLLTSIVPILSSLGFDSLGSFMPILGQAGENINFLNGPYYNKAFENPTDVERLINFDDHKAEEIEPKLAKVRNG